MVRNLKKRREHLEDLVIDGRIILPRPSQIRAYNSVNNVDCGDLLDIRLDATWNFRTATILCFLQPTKTSSHIPPPPLTTTSVSHTAWQDIYVSGVSGTSASQIRVTPCCCCFWFMKLEILAFRKCHSGVNFV